MDLAGTVDLLRQAVPAARVEPFEAADGMPSLLVERDDIVEVCRVLRDDPALQYAFLADVTAVDWLPAEPRFEVVYHLACLGGDFLTAGAASPAPPARLRLKVRVPGEDAHLSTVSSVWPTAVWPEREVFDLFGIAFDAHPDLRRILMPDDWQGHPLRRDYPVQINRETATAMPLQLTAEEFARNIRADRERAVRDASHPHGTKHE